MAKDHGAGRRARRRSEVKLTPGSPRPPSGLLAIFLVYLAGIVAAIGAAVVIGLTHH